MAGLRAEALRNSETCLRTLKGENETKILCEPVKWPYIKKLSFLQTPLKYPDLNHTSLFQKVTPVISDSQLPPLLINSNTSLAQPPVLQATQRNPSVPVTVISTIHLPPQRALCNTPQVEVVEFCQNENHLRRGKGGRKRKGKKRKKIFF